jgi:ABC-type sugar transport system substrate-binding protein
VDIIGYPPTTEGVISACNDAVTKQKYKALILESTIDPAGVPCASLAKQNNLPLIVTQDNIGSNPEDPKPTVPGVTSQIIIPLTDQAKALVYMVGQACLKLNPCNVGWLRATQSNAVTDSLVSTQLKSLTASDVNVKIVDQASPELDETTAVQDTTQFFSKSSDINVILTELSQSGDGALVALGQLGKPSGAVKVITTGCGTSEVKQVRSGQLFGCIPSVPVTETQLAVQYAASAARGAKIPDAVEPLTLEHLPQYLDTDNINQYPSFVGQFEL